MDATTISLIPRVAKYLRDKVKYSPTDPFVTTRQVVKRFKGKISAEQSEEILKELRDRNNRVSGYVILGFI